MNYENYMSTLCDRVSQLLYSLWITGLKLSTIRVGGQKPYNLTTNMLKAYIVYLPSLLYPPLFPYFLGCHPYISFHF